MRNLKELFHDNGGNMRLGIMQPYFFPYIGYFSLIKHTDRFILLDKVQFIRHGWIERNRILRQSGAWCYISVPLKKHSHNTLISDIEINNSVNWKQKIISQLGYYKGAPFFYKILNLVNTILKPEIQNIVELDLYALQNVCEYLGIKTPLEIFSKMALKIETPTEADEWALNICRSMRGVNEYWNPVGGKEIFNSEKYYKNNIELYFQKMSIPEYRQKDNLFEPALSIIDVMMFNSLEEIHYMLDSFELVR